MTSPFDDVKKGERYSRETSLSWAYILCIVLCFVCWTHVFYVCVDMYFYLCVLYEHVFIYDMSYLFWHGLVYDCLTGVRLLIILSMPEYIFMICMC